MGFKINQEATEQPKYCDYIQQKIDIAAENNATYELSDEDYRIQALYNDENLLTKDVVKNIFRVKLNEQGGKQYLVVSKTVDFFARDTKNANEPGAYRDRYVTKEGILEIPVRSTASGGTGPGNADSGAPTRIVYTIPFSKENVEKYSKNNDGVSFGFYEGATSSNRTPTTIPTVTNEDYFKDATWDELLLGREKKVLNSMVNRLPEVRKELNSGSSNNKSDTASSTETKTTTTSTTKEEVNKEEKVKEDNKDEDKKQVQLLEKQEESTTTTIEPLNKPVNSGGSGTPTPTTGSNKSGNKKN